MKEENKYFSNFVSLSTVRQRENGKGKTALRRSSSEGFFDPTCTLSSSLMPFFRSDGEGRAQILAMEWRFLRKVAAGYFLLLT